MSDWTGCGCRCLDCRDGAHCGPHCAIMADVRRSFPHRRVIGVDQDFRVVAETDFPPDAQLGDVFMRRPDGSWQLVGNSPVFAENAETPSGNPQVVNPSSAPETDFNSMWRC